MAPAVPETGRALSHRSKGRAPRAVSDAARGRPGSLRVRSSVDNRDDHPRNGSAHAPRPAQDPELEVCRHRARLYREGHDALRLGARLRLRPRPRRRSQVRLRKGPRGAADHGRGAGLSRQLARDQGIDRRLLQGPARRAVSEGAPPAAAFRHRRRQDARDAPARQGQGEGRGPLCRTHDRRQGERRADRHHDVRRHVARRRRLRRRARPAARAAQAARRGACAAPRPQGRAQRRPHLSLVGRSQPAARRSQGRRRRRLQDPDPARAVHLRRGRPRHRHGMLRRRPGAADRAAGALLGTRLSRRDNPHRDVAQRAPRSPSVPASSSATWSCSTTAWRRWRRDPAAAARFRRHASSAR